ncbi:UNVERIFIED_CONTAM: hypothetical protein Slati_1078000 [Sesamum latifolium]|uniref:Uncharacterized protein n=1 Tax=Sesamum latifolium TaxID=2727402 RepID=A0AAW2XUR1_9LAMI
MEIAMIVLMLRSYFNQTMMTLESRRSPTKFYQIRMMKLTDSENRRFLRGFGNEYQVETSSTYIGEFGYMSHPKKSGDAETGAHTLQNFLVGLPIPLAWISGLKHDMLGSHGSSITNSKNVTKTETSFSEIEPSHDSCKPMEELQNLSTADKVRKCSPAGYLLVPGLFDEYWSAAEKDSFLLGLYIFEKILSRLAICWNKRYGLLLSFYYGQFYGTQDVVVMSECRKMKNKKVFYWSEDIFWSEAAGTTISDTPESVRRMSKCYIGADYVSSLKAMVGMNILVEAVGIGKGKQDLTGMALEPFKVNQVILRARDTHRKGMLSLTTAEIIKFLSGDYRLSKARSNDLFWESSLATPVARGVGIRSKPKDQGYVAGSKGLLGFPYAWC